MRQLTDNFIDASFSESKEPVFVAKLVTYNKNIYFTSRQITINDAGSVQLHGVVNSANLAGQNIKPEDGLSSIGGMTLEINDVDRAFNSELTLIEQADKSIYNNKVEIYIGYIGLDFADYALVTPLYVESFNATELNYSIGLTDIQRISKKSLFADLHKTELVGNYGYENTSTIEVVDPSGFPLVTHGADWAEDPSLTVGYLKVEGVTKDGREVEEVISYTGITATEFTGVQRSRMGTERVNLNASEDGNAIEVELREMVYIDLVQPAMALALLTGDIYGQVGQKLPDNWHAGVDPSFVNIVSLEALSGALWKEHVEFRDVQTSDAKKFIFQQVLAHYGALARIDQTGQYYFDRYDYVNQQSASSTVLNYSQLINVGKSVRSAKNIKNNFLLKWGWRVDQNYYARQDYYGDGNSQAKYDYASDIEVVELRGLRNRSVTSKPSLDFVAQSLVKRKSNAQISRTVTCNIEHALQLEVGELVTIIADNEPDFRTGNSYQETFEVQGITFDFFGGKATLKLFASEGTPTQFNVSTGDNVANLSTAGRTNLGGSGYGVNDSGTFKFNSGANVPDGKYFFNGPVVIPNGRTISINGSFYVDAATFTMEANAKIDGKGRGLPAVGYFGVANTAQSGFEPNGSVSAWLTRTKIDYLNNQDQLTGANSTVKLDDVIRVQNGDSIESLIPSKLYGSYGPKGGDTRGAVEDDEGGIPSAATYTGGTQVLGGAGVLISANEVFIDPSAVIDTSGEDNNLGSQGPSDFKGGDEGDWQNTVAAGSSGFGMPGVCIVMLKDKNAAKPFLYDSVVAKSGAFDFRDYKGRFGYFKRGSNRNYITRFNADEYSCEPPAARSFANIDYASPENRSAIKVVNLVVAGAQKEAPVLDEVPTADSATISYNRFINTPRTAQGNQVTYELTASNTQAHYVLFEYRILPDGEFNPVEYKTPLESTLKETATGVQIEIKATSYNKAGKSGGVTLEQLTLPLVVKDSSTSAGGKESPELAIQVPPIRRLELVNNIEAQGGEWNQFKSGNAEFRWAKLSATAAGSITQLNGSLDLHLEGYNVRITDLAGNILREELTKEASYVYSYDKNKKDNNGTPIRQFKIQVQAISTTGNASAFTGFDVENPAPAAPSGVSVETGFTNAAFKFDLPSDVDFIGCDFYLVKGTGDPFTATPIRISGNTYSAENLEQNTEYRFGIKSVDQFGTGGSTTSLAFTTKDLEADDVTGLGAWATELDPVDAAFIAANMANDAMPSDKIASLVAGKITAGTITAQVEVGTGVLIDGTNGLVQTTNNGYDVTMGAHTINSQTYILSAADGNSVPFWVKPDGSVNFGEGQRNLSFDSGVLKLGRDASFDGNDSFGSDLLYKNLTSHAERDDEATVFSLSWSQFSTTKGSTVSYAAAGASTGRVDFFTDLAFNFGFLDFNKESSFKANIQVPVSNDDIFQLAIGGTASNSHGVLLLQFKGTNSGGTYLVRSAVREPNGNWTTMPETSTFVDAFSSEKSINLNSGNTFNPSLCKVELVFQPAANLSDSFLGVYINDIFHPELSYDGRSGFPPYNSNFANGFPTFSGSVFEVYQLPYFSLRVNNGGTGSGTTYILGDIKVMNGESPLK